MAVSWYLFYDMDAYRMYYGKLVDDKEHHARISKFMVKDHQLLCIVDYPKTISRPDASHSVNVISEVDAGAFEDSIKEFLTVKPNEVVIADNEVWIRAKRRLLGIKRGDIWFGLDKVIGANLSEPIYGYDLMVYDYYFDFVRDRINLILNR